MSRDVVFSHTIIGWCCLKMFPSLFDVAVPLFHHKMAKRHFATRLCTCGLLCLLQVGIRKCDKFLSRLRMPTWRAAERCYFNLAYVRAENFSGCDVCQVEDEMSRASILMWCSCRNLSWPECHMLCRHGIDHVFIMSWLPRGCSYVVRKALSYAWERQEGKFRLCDVETCVFLCLWEQFTVRTNDKMYSSIMFIILKISFYCKRWKE